ncbi:Transcriptional regulator, contains HTH domain [Halalkaliarchaeum sp. AArc-CO]|uniref:helix-turn-helix domain-containing protein n=1 Tax=unclassified Halalkaliarchaeum TaxID=2678344 RepID=UPI00217DCFEE|nr:MULTISPECIES: helix-turn-helix domain-containing protein [unclassified Halalkaliarchaeum]MDR5672044.1 helix-turn-helix domain-containing protein [Halalkaliarchaeum sp. AArc-GB]UWG51542.1 Transcriptional regulator, contains HTH domain [Halalkaliarchaeum sp. AArc-CO]
MSGIRAAFVVRNATGCPLARASSEIDGPIDGVTRSSRVESGAVIEEFELTTPEGTESLSDEEIRKVFSADGIDVYRFRRETADDCVCEVVERSGTPISAIRAENGALFLWLYASDVEAVRSVVSDLQAAFDDVRLRHLVRENDGAGDDYVLVNRSRLTERQREVVRTAFAMGYFDYDSGTNAGDVAEALGISHSTFAEHLAAAQTKLLEPILSD